MGFSLNSMPGLLVMLLFLFGFQIVEELALERRRKLKFFFLLFQHSDNQIKMNKLMLFVITAQRYDISF